MESPTASLAVQALALDQRVIEGAGAEDPGRLREVLEGLDDTALIEVLRAVGAMANLVDAVGSAGVGVFAARSKRGDEESLAKRLGERSAPIAVAALARVSMRRAIEWCTVGQALGVRRSLVGEVLPEAYPVLTEALDSGAVGAEAADLVVDTLAAIAPRRDLDQLAADEAFLVEAALVQTTSGLARICKSYLAHADPDGVQEREAELVAQAGTRVIQRRNGMVGILTEADPESAGFILTAIDARTSPRREVRFRTDDEEQDDAAVEDTRTLPRKRLDALVSISRDSLKADDGVVGGIAAKVLVTIDHEALLSGIGSATIAGIDQPISAATARRIACDALILPVVLGGKSQVLDFGEGRRLYSENQRLAMVALGRRLRLRLADLPGTTRPLPRRARQRLGAGPRQPPRPDRPDQRDPAVPLPPPPLRQRRLGPPLSRGGAAPDPSTLDRPRPDSPPLRTATAAQLSGSRRAVPAPPRTPRPRPGRLERRCSTCRDTGGGSQGEGSRVAVRRVSVLSTGQVRIRPQHVESDGTSMLWWLNTSRRWTAPRPINVYVIEHDQGLVLFDTGQDRRSVLSPDYFPRGLVGRFYRRLAEFEISDGDTLPAQLAALGYDIADVTTAILSHLHQDHIGGLRDLGHADIVVSAADWAGVGKRGAVLSGILRDHILLPGLRWTPVAADAPADPALAPFPSSHDLLGDGSLELVPTPGHTPGSLSLLLRPEGMPPLLLVGDLTYDADLLARERTPGVGKRSGLLASTRLVNEFVARNPGTLVLAAHDPSAAPRLRAAEPALPPAPSGDGRA